MKGGWRAANESSDAPPHYAVKANLGAYSPHHRSSMTLGNAATGDGFSDIPESADLLGIITTLTWGG